MSFEVLEFEEFKDKIKGLKQVTIKIKDDSNNEYITHGISTEGLDCTHTFQIPE